ncbi:MAG: ATP-binding protein [Ferruginibacter sp.]
MNTEKKIDVTIIENKTGKGAYLKKIVRSTGLPLKKIFICAAPSAFRLKDSRPGRNICILYLQRMGREEQQAVQNLLKTAGMPPLIILLEKLSVPACKKMMDAGVADIIPAEQLDGKLLERAMRYALEIRSVSNELKWSNERYYLVGEATKDMVWDWDLLNSKVFRSKEAWQNITGNATDYSYPDSWWNRVHPQDKKRVVAIVNKILKDRNIKNFEIKCRIIKDDGAVAHTIDKGYAIRNEKGEVIRLAGVTQDISAKLELEKTLEYERKKRQDEITAAVIAAQEREREAIGKELHDNINQVLATTKLYIEYAMQNGDMRDDFLENSKKFISSAVEEIRRLSRSLMPPSLGQVGLAMALTDLTDSIAILKRFRIHNDFKLLDEKKLNDDLRLTIFRIVQEQLTNIIKHAHAKNVRIKIKTLKKRLILEVEDDGRGFNKKQVSAGLGFKNISSRAQLHKGSLQLVTAKNKGCRIKLEFDL